MSTIPLPDSPVYAFAPVEDAELGVQQIGIFVAGMDAAIGTSLVVMTHDAALAVADRLNRPLGWTRESWTAFAAEFAPGAAAGGHPE